MNNAIMIYKNADNDYMKLALLEAEKAFAQDEVPVGAVIVDRHSGSILAMAHNMCEHHFDVTAHAEINVIREAARLKKETRLVGCDLYVTLEPCAMCAAAISAARIERLYYGAYDIKGGGVDHGVRFFESKNCFHKPEVYGGINEQACQKLLQDFFQQKRKIDQTKAGHD
jgi:tRNA(Arg) A34 adenosine deaminase TadA